MTPQSVTTTADGNCTKFTFDFPVFEPLEIEVLLGSTLQTSGYGLLGCGANSGGAVVFATAPANGTAVTLRRAGKVQVSGSDAPGFLEAKIIAGSNVSVTKTSDSTGEHLVIAADADPADFLSKAQNLADLPDAATARSNLGLAAIAASGSASDLIGGTVPAARLPNPGASTLGGVRSHAPESHQFLTGIGTDGIPVAAQPAAADVSGLAAVATSGSYADLSDKPSLGTVAALDVDTDATLSADSDSRVPSQKAVKAYVAANSPAQFRNLLIGGDFTTNPWQRGTSFTSVSAGQSNSYYPDRWQWQSSGSSAWTIQKTSDSPTLAQAGIYSTSCVEMVCTTATASPGGYDHAQLWQKIEGLNTAQLGFGQSNSKPVTLSFWVKTNIAGTYCMCIENSTQLRTYVSEFTVSNAGTWTKIVLTVPGDTAGTWRTDNGCGILVAFVLLAGASHATATPNTWLSNSGFVTANQANLGSAAGNYFRLALVQLEPGSMATPHEVLPEDVVLRRCLRYAFVTYNAGGVANGYINPSNQWQGVMSFPVVMRTYPAFSYSALSDFQVQSYGISASPGSISASYHCPWSAIIICSVSGGTVGHGGIFLATTTTARLVFSAEL